MNAPKDPNPKDLIGVTKVPLNLIPATAKAHTAMAFRDGAIKYGPYNWRQYPVKTSVYLAAVERHIDAYQNGETHAPDSGVHHLGHAVACLAILLDAEEAGNLIDDRPVPLDMSALFERLRVKDGPKPHEVALQEPGESLRNIVAVPADHNIPRRVPRHDDQCLTEPEDDGFETFHPKTPQVSG